MTLTPAYGRDYKNKSEAIAAFESGKDFIATDYQKSGAYNINEMKPGQTVQIRYKRMTMVCIYTKKPT